MVNEWFAHTFDFIALIKIVYFHFPYQQIVFSSQTIDPYLFLLLLIEFNFVKLIIIELAILREIPNAIAAS